jgi:hypothetical protein
MPKGWLRLGSKRVVMKGEARLKRNVDYLNICESMID